MSCFYLDRDTFEVEDGRVLISQSRSRTEGRSRRALPAGLCNDRPPLTELSNGGWRPEFKIGVLNISIIEKGSNCNKL